MVKKLETALTAEFMIPPWLTLRLACCPPQQAYSTPIEGDTGGGCKAYGLEDIAGVHHGKCRSKITAAQCLSGDRKPDTGGPVEEGQKAAVRGKCRF